MKRKNPWAAFEEAARAYKQEYGQSSESSQTKEKSEPSIAANNVGSSSDASIEKMAPTVTRTTSTADSVTSAVTTINSADTIATIKATTTSGVSSSSGGGGKKNAFALLGGKASLWSTAEKTLVLRKDPNSRPSKHVVAFDFDGTLTDHGGYRSASSANDYEVWNENVVPTLRRLFHKEGKTLVIFSNQGSIGDLAGKNGLHGKQCTKVRKAIDAFIAKVGVPMDAILATGKDGFRKPQAGMKDYYLGQRKPTTRPSSAAAPKKKAAAAMRFGGVAAADEEGGGGGGGACAIDVFVGDAAGRFSDHSDSDLGFARAAGVAFATPEAFFRGLGGRQSLREERAAAAVAAVSAEALQCAAAATFEQSPSSSSSSQNEPAVWHCPVCTLINPWQAVECVTCLSERPSAGQAAGGEEAAGSKSSRDSSLSSSTVRSRLPPLEEALIAKPPNGQTPICLLLVGLIGSGKSTFAAELARRCVPGSCSSSLSSWVVVCQDELGSKKKCAAAITAAARAGRCVIVDRQNHVAADRDLFAQAAKAGAPAAAVHALVFDLPYAVCREQVLTRTGHPSGVQGEGGVRIMNRFKFAFEPITATEAHFEAISICKTHEDTAVALEKYAAASSYTNSESAIFNLSSVFGGET